MNRHQELLVADLSTALRAELESISSALDGAGLPSRTREIGWWQSYDGTGAHGYSETREELDFSSLWAKLRESEQRQQDEARGILDSHVERYLARLEADQQLPPMPGVLGMLTTKLITRYLETTGSTYWNAEVAATEIQKLVCYLDSHENENTAVWLLQDFSADHAFTLGDSISVNQITEDDLRTYAGRSRQSDLFSLPERTFIPYDSWWVVRASATGPKNTFVASNTCRQAHELFMPLFRLLGGGAFQSRFVGHRSTNPYGQVGETFSSDWTVGAYRGPPYHLTEERMEHVPDVWGDMETVIRDDGHYLQTSLRRLIGAGKRLSREDALVDCVIGLENLLGERSGENTFKVSMRGGRILGNELAGRRTWRRTLETLYGLRSDIVHNGRPSEENMQEQSIEHWLAQAEDALREVWWWFFRNHGGPGGAGDGKLSLNNAMLGEELPQ